MNIIAYIDGFNLYNGALRGSPHKWLNLHLFAQNLRPTDTILRVKYCTARVTAFPSDIGQPIRQQIYWRALKTIPTIVIIEGQFKRHKKRLPDVADSDRIEAMHRSGTNMSGIVPRKVDVYRIEEKGTDVNIAVNLVHDARINSH